MSQEHRTRSGIYRELDAAFATVQAARLRHEPGSEDTRSLARECVVVTTASIKRQMLETALSPAESSLIEAKLRALIGAAARIPGPGATAHEHQPPNTTALLGSKKSCSQNRRVGHREIKGSDDDFGA